MLPRLCIHLADDERGNSTMYSVACLAAGERAERPLLVTVYEHGGWWLSYLFDEVNAGTVVSSANDGAVFYGPAREARSKYGRVPFRDLGHIRRKPS